MQNVQKVKYFDKKTFKGSKITQKARNFLFLACRKIQWTRKELESFGLEFSYFNTCFSKYSYCICLKSKKSINIKKLIGTNVISLENKSKLVKFGKYLYEKNKFLEILVKIGIPESRYKKI